MATTSIGAPGVVFPDGTTQASASPGNVITRIYTSGSTTWTKPSSLKAIKVTLVAGGGGGTLQPTTSRGGGGGAAGYLYLQAPSIPGPVTVTVGAGGAPSPGAAGPGGTTSFGALASATGGTGGNPAVPSGSPGGSMSTTPTIVASNGLTSFGGNGGSSGFGFGLGNIGSTSSTDTGVGYGYGGKGGTPTGGSTAGGNGIVVVEEFY